MATEKAKDNGEMKTMFWIILTITAQSQGSKKKRRKIENT
jgi:hypothetical protein